MLDRLHCEPYLDNLITCDEKWVPFVNEWRHGEWRSPGQKPGQVPKGDFRAKKAMLCVWWHRLGIIHWELLEKGKTVNANVYCDQLERIRQKLRRRKIPVIFLQDNARPHVARKTLQKISDMNWERLEHPAYSPDLSPSDYYLFRSMEHWLRGKKFTVIEEMRQSLTYFFASKDRGWYHRGIHKLAEQLQKVIESGGEYFE